MSRINTALVASVLLTTTAVWAAPAELFQCPLGHLGLKSIRSVIELESSEIIVTDEIGDRTIGFRILPRCSGGDFAWREVRPEELSPAGVVASKAGFTQIVSSRYTGSPMRIDLFNSDLRRIGQVPLVEKNRNYARRSKDTVLAVYPCWTVVQDTIFAYGALDSGGYVPRMGFFTFNAGRPELVNGKLKGELVVPLMEYYYYVLGLPYMATMGERVYYLEMADTAALYAYSPSEDRAPVYLEGFPGSDESLDAFHVNALGTSYEIYAAVERLSIPAGIYADAEQGFLYLLRRKPVKGLVAWTMTKLQPKPKERKVEVLDSVNLPTMASHLTVYFTADAVLVFEKSSVRPDRTQDVDAVLVIPRTWVTEPGTSLLRK